MNRDPGVAEGQTSSGRGDDEFIFAVPPGWIDLSSDEKAATAPITLLRQSTAGDTPPRFFAIDAPPAHATITAAVRSGKLRIVPNTPDQLRFGMPSDPKLTFVRGDIVTLSETPAVVLEFEDRDRRHTWFYIPGRLRTAIIRCGCPRAQLAHYAPLFEAVAVAAARGAETAPEVWAEVERARADDPRREFLAGKLAGFVVLGVAVALAIGLPLGFEFELTLICGAFLGIIFAFVWAARGGAPMLPGGDGNSED